MKHRVYICLMSFLAALSVGAQRIDIYRNGRVAGSYDLSEVDSITYDHRINLWEQAEKTLSYYYAPSWNVTTAPATTYTDGVYTIPLTKATYAQWQAQMFFVTNLSTDSHRQYDFSVTLCASKRIAGATVKLYADGNDNVFYFSERITLTAGEPYVFERKNMTGIDLERLSLVLDFGGNAASTTVTVSDIRLHESDVDTSADIQCPIDGYRLVWHDEFAGSSVSTLRWSYQTAEAGWVNHELQTYVSGKSPKGKKVAEVGDGTLKIRAFKEGDKIYSARMYGHKNVGFRYGYIEARIKLPRGKGTWPAFWMMPVRFTSWPADGEIDIMEEVGVDPNVVSSSIHCTAYNHPNNTQKTHSMTCNAAEQSFHVYALEWTPDYIKTYVDGQPQLSFGNDGKGNKDTWPFNVAFYPILNLAWGGDWGGYAGVDEAALPVTMEIDYVRVWQK